MLSKKYRLPRSATFSQTNTYRTPLFLLKWQKTTDETPLFGFVVSKKVDRRAVERNRVKRLLRSCVEEHLPKVLPGYAFLFILQPGIKTATRDQMNASLTQALKKIEGRP